MRSLFEYYIAECGDAAATPANTVGMGEPAIVDGVTITEPIVVKKKKKRKV